MKRITVTCFAVVVALVLCGLTMGPCLAQEVVKPTVDPSVCRRMQAQIDEMVSVSRDQSLTQDQKVAALTKSWAQSLSTMRDNSVKDDEMAKMVKELNDSVSKVLALALATSPAGQQGVSPQANLAMKDLTEHIKPYMSFMKMLCPDLVLPGYMPK
jgi:hypothetical protein